MAPFVNGRLSFPAKECCHWIRAPKSTPADDVCSGIAVTPACHFPIPSAGSVALGPVNVGLATDVAGPIVEPGCVTESASAETAVQSDNARAAANFVRAAGAFARELIAHP